MNTQDELARIRALLADMQRPHTTSVWLELEGELTRLVPALLDAYDAQAAVIEAAGAVDVRVFRSDGFLHKEYAGAAVELFDLREALAGMKGESDGTR